jgi:hypothetical protein
MAKTAGVAGLGKQRGGHISFIRVKSRRGVADKIVSEPMSSHKPSHFEVLTKLILPVLSLTAFILAQWKGQETLLRPLLGLAFLSIVIGFWSTIKGGILNWTNKVHQHRLARKLLPDLRTLAHNFSQFIDPSFRCGSLNSVLSAESPPVISQMNLPTLDLFYGPWFLLIRRLSHAMGTTTEFLDAALELDSLIRSYNCHCVLAVFERMPDQIRASLSTTARRGLAMHRESFVLYLRDYEQFCIKARELLPESAVVGGFQIPRPLP